MKERNQGNTSPLLARYCYLQVPSQLLALCQPGPSQGRHCWDSCSSAGSNPFPESLSTIWSLNFSVTFSGKCSSQGIDLGVGSQGDKTGQRRERTWTQRSQSFWTWHPSGFKVGSLLTDGQSPGGRLQKLQTPSARSLSPFSPLKDSCLWAAFTLPGSQCPPLEALAESWSGSGTTGSCSYTHPRLANNMVKIFQNKKK